MKDPAAANDEPDPSPRHGVHIALAPCVKPGLFVCVFSSSSLDLFFLFCLTSPLP